MHINVESLYRAPEVNIIWYSNYSLIKINKRINERTPQISVPSRIKHLLHSCNSLNTGVSVHHVATPLRKIQGGKRI